MNVGIATLTGFCGVIAALLGIYLKVSKIVQVRSEQRDKRQKMEMQERKEEIHDEITIPVDKLKDKVADLGTTVHEFIDRQLDDHQDVVKMMAKLDKHDHIIENHTHTLDKHTDAIDFLKRTKADKYKKNRGNKK